MLQKNAIIVAVAATQDYGVRYLYNPLKKTLSHSVYDSETGFAVHGYGEEVAEQIIGHTLEQYAAAHEDGQWNGHLAIITNRNAAIRLRSIRKAIRNDVDADDVADSINDNLSFNLSDSHMEAISDIAGAYEYFLDEDNNISVSDYDSFNLHNWRVFTEEGVEVKAGDKVTFTRGDDNQLYALDGKLRLETNGAAYENVELELVEVQDNRRTTLAVARIGESARLKNCQKLWDKTLALFDAEDDLDTIEDIDEDSAEEEEEDIDEMDDTEATA